MGDVGRLLSLGSFLGMGACIYTIAIVYTVSSVVWLDNNVLLVQYERFAIHTGPSTGKLRRARWGGGRNEMTLTPVFPIAHSQSNNKP